MKTNKNKKYIIILLLLMIVIIFSCNTVYAAEWNVDFDTSAEKEGIGERVSKGVNGFVGVLTYGIKALVLAILGVLQLIIGAVISIGTDAAQTNVLNLSPANFIFNKIELTTINFFETGSNLDYVNNIQNSIAQWYYVIRNISIIILLGILIYVGIRMAISTLAEDKAKYKKMLTDWIVSLVLVYVLQYIMIIVIEINNSLVNMFANVFGLDTGDGLSDAMTYLYAEAWSVSATQSWGCTILYGMLIIMTVIFMIMYMKRFIVAAFLTMIAPLITITYSIDKMGDGKSQALNTWLREYCYNILIQPFHCVIYGTLVMSSITTISSESDKSIACLIMCVATMFFIYNAENLVKKIFGVEPSGLGSALAAGGLAITAIKTLTPKNNEKNKKSGGELPNNNLNAGMSAPNTQNSNASQSTSNSTGRAQQTNNSSRNSTTTSNTANNAGTTRTTQQGATQVATGNNSTGKKKTTAKGENKVLNALGKGAKTYVTTSARIADGVAGAILGAGTGEIGGVLAGYSLGKGVSDSVETKINNRKYNRETDFKENAIGAEFNEWASVQNTDDPEVLMDRFNNIIDTDDEELEPEQLKLKSYMSALEKQYRGGGEDKTEARDHLEQTVRDFAYNNRTVDTTKYSSSGGYIGEQDIYQRRLEEQERQEEKKRRYDIDMYKEAVKEIQQERNELAQKKSLERKANRDANKPRNVREQAKNKRKNGNN